MQTRYGPTTSASIPASDPDTALPAGATPSGHQPVPSTRVGLLDLDWQKALVVLLTLLAGLALLWVLWQVLSPILHTLILFALAAVLAFALSGPVDALTARTGRRLVAIVGIYAGVGVVVVGGIVVLAGPFVRQATELANALPQYAADLQARAPEVQTALGQYGIQADLDQLKARAAVAVEQGGTDVLQHLVGTLAEIGGLLLDAVLALVISLYLLVDGPKLRARIVAAIPARHQGKALFLQDNVSRVLGGYLRGQLTLAAIVGVLAGVGTALLGLPYAVVLGVLAGLFEMVPMFGPILSAIPAVLVALFLPFPTVLWVILFFLVVQQVENNVLVPRISGHAVGLHPLGALFALLAGFQLAGLLGGLFAVPIAGVLWVLLTAGYRNAVAERPPPRPWPLPRWRRPAARAEQPHG